MKVLYLRKSNIINSNIRQDYLNSLDKQEYLLFSSKLDDLLDFKNINKELVIELPNELNDVVTSSDISFEDIHDLYVSKFKELTGYDNVSMAIHLNDTRTNLHAHLSYVDRKLVTKYQVAKKDMYIYTSTGKRLKKQDYKEDNPNHLIIKKGEQLLDYSKVDEFTKEKYKQNLSINSSLSNKEKFELRRYIKDNYKKVDKVEYSSCLESGLSLVDQKSVLNNYKEEFINFNNDLLNKFGYQEKYVTKDDYVKYGFETKKKIGKINDKPNNIQKNNQQYNDIVDEYNHNIMNIIKDKDITKEVKETILVKEVKRKREYKSNKNNQTKNEKLNYMIKRLMNLKEGIENLSNLLERGKEYVRKFNRQYTKGYKESSRYSKGESNTTSKAKQETTKDNTKSKERDRGPSL